MQNPVMTLSPLMIPGLVLALNLALPFDPAMVLGVPLMLALEESFPGRTLLAVLLQHHHVTRVAVLGRLD